MASAVAAPEGSFDREFRVHKRFIKKPDVKARDDALAKVTAEIKKKDTQLVEINAQIKKSTVNPEVADKRKALVTELGELRKTQATLKEKRDIINSKVKEIDSSLKRKLNEITAVTSKYPFKTVEDIDNKIKRSEDDIASGSLSLVDERRTVKEISALRKLRKDFAGLDVQQKSIDTDKNKIAELKKELSGLNPKEVSAKYEAVQKELDALTLSNKSVNDKRNDLFTKRNALNKDKDVLYSQLKTIKAEFDQSFKNFKKALSDETKRVATEEKKLRAEKAKSERKSKLDKELSEASKPAFEEEINTIHTLLNYFDPSYVKPASDVDFNTGSLTSNKTGRTVAAIDDFEIIKKDKVAFISGTNNIKSTGKKGKKAGKKFILDPDVITSLGDLSIALPLSKDDVPQTVEALSAKLKEFQTTQEESTKKNIENAKAKIAKMEAEWAKEDAKEAEAEAEAEAAKGAAAAAADSNTADDSAKNADEE